MAKLVSTTYGEALFELAQEKQIADTILNEITCLQKAFDENPEFATLMKHPKISKEESILILHNVLDGRVNEDLVGFIELVLVKDRYAQLNEIFEYYEARVKEAEGIGKVYVTSAVPLKENQKSAIESKLLATTGYRKMEIAYEVDSSLIGGMKIRIKDRVVDSSVSSKLERMERNLQKIQLG